VSECTLIVQAETTVINQCKQLLSPSADPTYATTYISHSFPQHRNYLCAGAWILMNGHPENINSANLVHYPIILESYLNSIYANATSFLGSLLSPLHKKLLYNILNNNNFFS
jgi:mediator of RNA polymerase II transcription subunit 23